MKHIFRLVILLTFSLKLSAQDTVSLKRTANIIARATEQGDYKTVVDNTYPKLIGMAGGKEVMVGMADSSMKKLQKSGITIAGLKIGNLGAFYKAGTEIHCLVPDTLTLKIPGGRAIAKSYLLAISEDGGKVWSFIDLQGQTEETISQILPNFNHDLKVPKTEKPLLIKD
jgi:hypothetical protein